MEYKSLINLYGFVTECSNVIHKKEIDLLEGFALESIGNFGDELPSLPMDAIPTDYMRKQIGIWESISQRIPELTDYFSRIYIRKDFLNAPTMTVPVLDVNEVRTIKPQYLKKFIDECIGVIDRAINAKSLELDFDITKTDKMINTLKRNMVETNIPTYMRTEKSITFNNPRVDGITPAYVQGTILPFFRRNMEELEEMQKVSDNIQSIVTEGSVKLRNYAETILRLLSERKISNPEKSYQATFACINVFLEASKYLIGQTLRKMYIYAFNVKAYGSLKDTLSSTFKEDSFTESTVTDINSFLSHIHNTRVELEKEVMESAGIGKNELRRDVKKSPFDINQFRYMNTLFSGLKHDFEALESATQDSELSMEEIQSSVTSKHSSYYRDLPTINVYTESELDDYECKVGMIREMIYAESFFERYLPGLDTMIENVNDLGELITRNPYNMYPNTLRNEEEVLFLQEEVEELETIRDGIMNNYAERLSNMQEYLYGDYSHPTFESDGESYLEESMKANLDIQQFMQEKDVHNAYMVAYESVIKNTRLSDPIMFVEADQPTTTNQNGTNQNNQNQNTNNGQNTQNTNNQKKEDTKPTVTDNQNNQDNNTNNQNNTDNKDENGEKKEGSLEKILQKIIDFATNLKGKLNDSLKKLKPNLKWIEANEDALRNRSYNNVTVDILPYNTSVKYVELIDICTNTLKNDIKPDRIANGSTSEDKIETMFRSRLHLPSGGDTKLNEKLLINLKSNGAGLKTTPISNGRLKQEINVMIDYCKYYYGSFDGDMSNALDRLTDAVNTVKNNVNNLEKVDKAANLLAYLGTLTNNVCGTIADVARDRSNDYLKVLQSLVPKQKNTNNNQNTSGNENNNEQNQNTDNGNNNETTSSQPTS